MTATNQGTDKDNDGVATNKFDFLYRLGFTKKKATVREFVTLLVLGLFFYAFLHWIFPPKTTVSLEAKLADTEVLIEIIEQQKQLEVEVSESIANNVISPSLEPRIREKSPKQHDPFLREHPETKDVIENNLNQLADNNVVASKTTANSFISLSLNPEIIEKWRQQLEPFLNERPQTKNIIEDNLNQLADKNFAELTKDDLEEIQAILNNLQKSLRGYELSCSEEKKWWETILWTNEKKWWEIIFWSLFGTLCFLIQQTSDYKLKKDFLKNKDQEKSSQQDNPQAVTNPGKADSYLERYKPKYYYFLLRSPFYTLIILFVLSGADLNIVGISVSLSSLGTPVFVALAFILGFANKVATEQLDLIIAAIFKNAWQRTVSKIDIYPSTLKIRYGESCDFQVVPDVKVNWTIWSQPSVGAIDSATGMYIAPPKPGCFYNDRGELIEIDKSDDPDDPKYRQVIIRAEREYEPKVSSLALVTLIDENIEKTEVKVIKETLEDSEQN